MCLLPVLLAASTQTACGGSDNARLFEAPTEDPDAVQQDAANQVGDSGVQPDATDLPDSPVVDDAPSTDAVDSAPVVPCVGQGWEHFDIFNEMEVSGADFSLLLDLEGRPHVMTITDEWSSYSRRGLTHYYLGANGWEQETVDVDAAYKPALAIDAAGTLHVLYHPYSNVSLMLYGKKVMGGQWEIEPVPVIDATCSLVVDPMGRPNAMCYRHKDVGMFMPSEDALTHLWRDNGWASRDLEFFSSEMGTSHCYENETFPGLVVGSDGLLHTAYPNCVESHYGADTLRHAVLVEDGWISEDVAPSIGQPHALLGKDGQLILTGGLAPKGVRVLRQTPDGWSQSDVPGVDVMFSHFDPVAYSPAVTPSGQVVVAGWNTNTESFDRVTLWSQSGDSWTSEEVAVDGATRIGPEMAVDRTGVAHIIHGFIGFVDRVRIVHSRKCLQ